MGAQTQDSHVKPFVLVVLDVSFYDPAMPDSLISVGRVIEAGFTVIHRIPSQAKEDRFSLKTIPLYGGTITMPDGKTILVMEYKAGRERGWWRTGTDKLASYGLETEV